MEQGLGIDANHRPIDVIHDAKVVKEGLLRRVTECAVPFLMMWRPTEVVCTLGLGGLKAIYLIRISYTKLHEGQRLEGGKAAALGALVLGFTGLSLLRPRVAAILGMSYQLLDELAVTLKAARDGEGKKAQESLVKSVRDLIYIASIAFRRSDLLLLSLSVQASTELSRSVNELRGPDKRWLEAVAHFALALIRGCAAIPHFDPARREWFGNDLTQEEFDRLLVDIQVIKQGKSLDERVDFEGLLAERNFRNHLKGLKTRENALLDHLIFRNIRIEDCTFRSTYFRHSIFSNVSVSQSDFSESDFFASLFNGCNFDEVNLTEASFYRSHFSDVTFHSSNFLQAQLGETVWEQSLFTSCALPEADFFLAKAKQTTFKECDLTDTLLFDSAPEFKVVGGKANNVTRPVIGILWDFETPHLFAGLQVNAIRGLGAIVTFVDYRLRSIDKAKLGDEIEWGLLGLRDGLNGHPSIPKALIAAARPESELTKIQALILRGVGHWDGFILPGGEHVPARLYGETPIGIMGEALAGPPDYGRSFLESYVMAHHKGPLIGICRGHQRMGVEFGQKLIQEIDNHRAVMHYLRPPQSASQQVLDKVHTLFGGQEVASLSFHSQALEGVPEGFELLLEHRGIPKAMIREGEGAPTWIGMQIHPETWTTWEDFPQHVQHVIYDPSKLSNEELLADWRLFLARLQDEDAILPFDPEKYAGMRERNRQVFTYFLSLVEQDVRQRRDPSIGQGRSELLETVH